MSSWRSDEALGRISPPLSCSILSSLKMDLSLSFFLSIALLLFVALWALTVASWRVEVPEGKRKKEGRRWLHELSWCNGGVGAVGFSLLGYSFLLLFFSCCWVSSPLGLLLCVVRKEKRVRKVCEEDGLCLCCEKRRSRFSCFFFFSSVALLLAVVPL